MSKNKRKWNSEKILSLTAMVMSFITLVIFVYQTNLMSKQNHLSILPYLALSTSDNVADQVFELNILNHGVGPAIIESVTIIYQDKGHHLSDYEDNLFKFLREKSTELDSIKNWSYSTLERGMAIPANSEYNIIRVKGSRADFELFRNKFKGMLAEGLDFEIVYSSIQDERWLIRTNSQGPVKLD